MWTVLGEAITTAHASCSAQGCWDRREQSKESDRDILEPEHTVAIAQGSLDRGHKGFELEGAITAIAGDPKVPLGLQVDAELIDPWPGEGQIRIQATIEVIDGHVLTRIGLVKGLQCLFRLLKRLKLAIESTPEGVDDKPSQICSTTGIMPIEKLLLVKLPGSIQQPRQIECTGGQCTLQRSAGLPRELNTDAAVILGVGCQQSGQLKAVVAEFCLGLDFSDSNAAIAGSLKPNGTIQGQRVQGQRSCARKCTHDRIKPRAGLRLELETIEGELTGLPADHPGGPTHGQ